MHFAHEDNTLRSWWTNTVRVFNELVKLPETLVAVISRYIKEMAVGMAEFQGKGLNKKKVFSSKIKTNWISTVTMWRVPFGPYAYLCFYFRLKKDFSW